MTTSCTQSKTVESYLRAVAGAFIIIAALLTHFHSSMWIWFILFIGANLFQSAFTNWCPMIMILKKLFKLDKRAI